MKNQFWTALLVMLLFLGALASAALSFVYVQSTRQLNELQAKANAISQYKNLMQALAAEAIEFSRRDPSIEPILNDIGIRTRPMADPKNK